MTDWPTGPERRPDLGALDLAPDRARTDAVVAAVMARIATGGRLPADDPRRRPIPEDDLARLVRARRRLLSAAAVLAVIAAGAVLAAPRRARMDPALDLITRWASAEHVPTNGELLATFQEYRP